MFFTSYQFDKAAGDSGTTYMVLVYDVKRDRHGYPHFLIFWRGQWKYVSAKHFKPMPAPFAGGAKEAVIDRLTDKE